MARCGSTVCEREHRPKNHQRAAAATIPAGTKPIEFCRPNWPGLFMNSSVFVVADVPVKTFGHLAYFTETGLPVVLLQQGSAVARKTDDAARAEYGQTGKLEGLERTGWPWPSRPCHPPFRMTILLPSASPKLIRRLRQSRPLVHHQLTVTATTVGTDSNHCHNRQTQTSRLGDRIECPIAHAGIGG